MKKKKLWLIVVGVLVIFVVAFAVFSRNMNKRFDFEEKSTVTMGTVVTQKIYSDNADECITELSDAFTQLENKISWRIEDSEVASLNGGKVVTDKELANMISDSLKVCKDSGGRFDITVGNITTLWNVGEENERIPKKSEIENALKNVGYESVKVDSDKVSIGENQFVDLGAVGKGIACDKAKEILEKNNVKGAIISVGGSVIAYGQYNKAGFDWQIAIQNPRKESEFLGVIKLDSGFVSTSGDYERYFEKDGKRYHHIMDAKTGYPSESDLISVTVVTKESGLLSDALSTACFILGEEEGKKLINKYDAAAVFVDSDMNVTTVGDINFEAQQAQ